MRKEKSQDNRMSLEPREENASLKVTTMTNAVDWLEVKLMSRR